MLVAHDTSNLEKACEKIRETTGQRAGSYSADLSSPRGVATAFEALHGAYGQIDILVNNASDTRAATSLPSTWKRGRAASRSSPSDACACAVRFGRC